MSYKFKDNLLQFLPKTIEEKEYCKNHNIPDQSDYYHRIGAKAQSLVFLKSIGLHVPETMIWFGTSNAIENTEFDTSKEYILRSSSQYVMDGILPSEIHI